MYITTNLKDLEYQTIQCLDTKVYVLNVELPTGYDDFETNISSDEFKNLFKKCNKRPTPLTLEGLKLSVKYNIEIKKWPNITITKENWEFLSGLDIEQFSDLFAKENGYGSLTFLPISILSKIDNQPINIKQAFEVYVKTLNKSYIKSLNLTKTIYEKVKKCDSCLGKVSYIRIKPEIKQHVNKTKCTIYCKHECPPCQTFYVEDDYYTKTKIDCTCKDSLDKYLINLSHNDMKDEILLLAKKMLTDVREFNFVIKHIILYKFED